MLQDSYEDAKTVAVETSIFAEIGQACAREGNAQEVRHCAEASKSMLSAEATKRSALHCSVKSSSSTASSSTAKIATRSY